MDDTGPVDNFVLIIIIIPLDMLCRMYSTYKFELTDKERKKYSSYILILP